MLADVGPALPHAIDDFMYIVVSGLVVEEGGCVGVVFSLGREVGPASPFGGKLLLLSRRIMTACIFKQGHQQMS